ncbi:hypothetical protein GGTG_00256 [Gaeumannomyces tritici R3-111a-1]|uniref:Uncharacterized protein n=1 Tax=Gaeumannomyces tritici (strain R3-111a-1) TaxID=644352 RepID=J3NG63_GAET3|nr:hypothetical protein GGTG_00256 [Gaeumannomyces tritici R3-111a-1]EJT80253.1 hypothetical protein GGTG_00256 [Gaeumannomyces tritici R3-111a-1]
MTRGKAFCRHRSRFTDHLWPYIGPSSPSSSNHFQVLQGAKIDGGSGVDAELGPDQILIDAGVWDELSDSEPLRAVTVRRHFHAVCALHQQIWSGRSRLIAVDEDSSHRGKIGTLRPASNSSTWNGGDELVGSTVALLSAG